MLVRPALSHTEHKSGLDSGLEESQVRQGLGIGQLTVLLERCALLMRDIRVKLTPSGKAA